MSIKSYRMGDLLAGSGTKSMLGDTVTSHLVSAGIWVYEGLPSLMSVKRLSAIVRSRVLYCGFRVSLVHIAPSDWLALVASLPCPELDRSQS